MFNKLVPLTAILTTAAFAQQPSLKDAFQGLFRVGAALNQRQFEEKNPHAAGIIAAPFNTISPESIMTSALSKTDPALLVKNDPETWVAAATD
jgi:hypothetical protein